VRSSTRPYPLDEDEIEGLAVEDVDGDGRILQMRIEDANGLWKAHPQEPRLMVRREPTETGGTYYRILPEGRYEGYDLQQVTFPVRVLHALGARTLVVSNACGGMHPLWSPGDLVLISDHINLLGDNPLVGPNDERLGPRFPDMSAAYDPDLRALTRAAALELGIVLREGVYVAVPGPNLETRAEYRMLRAIGADVVGMSTVPEVIVANHQGMRTVGISIITDQCLPDALEPAEIGKIIATANRAEPSLTRLITTVVERLS
jgi:purine-nucleoside phosphorylase